MLGGHKKKAQSNNVDSTKRGSKKISAYAQASITNFNCKYWTFFRPKMEVLHDPVSAECWRFREQLFVIFLQSCFETIFDAYLHVKSAIRVVYYQQNDCDNCVSVIRLDVF